MRVQNGNRLQRALAPRHRCKQCPKAVLRASARPSSEVGGIANVENELQNAISERVCV
jgi:hypothetical protein